MFVCQLDEAVGDVPPPVEAHHLGLHVPTGSLQDRTQVSHGWTQRIQVKTNREYRCETESTLKNLGQNLENHHVSPTQTGVHRQPDNWAAANVVYHVMSEVNQKGWL